MVQTIHNYFRKTFFVNRYTLKVISYNIQNNNKQLTHDIEEIKSC